MTYPISDVTRRVVYSGSAAKGPYQFAFEILDENDISVYVNSTLLTITTDYTVTINADGTGSILLITGNTLSSTPGASDSITIVGSKGNIPAYRSDCIGGQKNVTGIGCQIKIYCTCSIHIGYGYIGTVG